MMSVTRSRARSARVGGALPAVLSVVVSAVLLVAAGCDSGDDIGGKDDDSPSSSHGTDAPSVETVTTIEHGGDGVTPDRQTRMVERVTAVVDAWFDDAFLGEFPRSDYSSAFASFTKDAAADAQRDLELVSSSGIADRIESATATNRRVRLDVFAPDGHPRGVTANFVLDFDTAGDLEEHLRVHGALYLVRTKGEWKVFGYDVDEAAPL